MIVLDEHLKKRDLSDAIRKWYPGAVCYVTDLRPGSVVKDEAIITLLRSTPGAVFVTLDWNDVWLEQLASTDRYCLTSFSVAASKADTIPALLRRVLAVPGLKTKSGREGKVIRVGGDDQIEVLNARGVIYAGHLV